MRCLIDIIDEPSTPLEHFDLGFLGGAIGYAKKQENFA